MVQLDVIVTERNAYGGYIAVRVRSMYFEDVIRVGSVWRSNDPRDRGRELQVTHIFRDHAQVQNIKNGRRGQIRLDRFLGDSRNSYTKVR